MTECLSKMGRMKELFMELREAELHNTPSDVYYPVLNEERTEEDE